MANIFSNQTDPAHDREVKRYFAAILALALLFQDGDITRSQYTRRHLEITEAMIIGGIVMAGGILTAERTLEYLREQSATGIPATRQLANDLANGRYLATEDKPADVATTQLENRLGLWTFTAGSAYVIGQLTKPPTIVRVGDNIVDVEPHFNWRFGLTEDHCITCLTHRNAGNQTRGYWDVRPQPQSPILACGGWRCDCFYEEVPIDEVVRSLVSAGADDVLDIQALTI